jgi:uncharacterized protein YndB with AHSA1/START domain
MNEAVVKPDTQSIVVDEVLPHAPETIWKALTSGDLIVRWLKMPAAGFAPLVGTHFTLKTTPAGPWDGFIRCEVLEAIPNQRLVYSWISGHADNVGYGAALNTVVTWTLSRVETGTRVRLVHSGFVLPRNELAFRNMGQGWKGVIPRVGEIAGEQDLSKKTN